MLALLTILATTVTVISTGQDHLVEQIGRTAQADEVDDSAIRLTLLHLSVSDGLGNYWAPEKSPTLSLLGHSVSMQIERESERVDLNSASDEVLVGFFASNGWSETEARTMAARIEDWRSNIATGQPALNGPSLPGNFPSRYSPRHGPFASVEELRQVPGNDQITPELYDCLTVYSGSVTPLQTSTRVPVRRTLQWLAGLHDGLSATPIFPSRGDRVSLVGEVLRVRACSRSDTDQHCRTAVVRLTGNGPQPWLTLYWASI